MKISDRLQGRNGKSQQQNGMGRIAPVFGILLLMAFAALAAPHAQFQRGDQDRDRAFGRIWVARERMDVDFGGGNGGRPSADAVCQEGWVAVAFHVQTGEYFNTAWLDCAPVRPDGMLGDEQRMTERTGTPGGAAVHNAFCREGRALRGLHGRTGASIDEAIGECSWVREIADRDHPEGGRSEPTEAVMRPNAGGHPARAVCPPGSVVTGFRSMSGEWMDHLWILCSEVRRER